MCLYVKEENAKLITAEKDITCYKILRKSVDRFGELLQTPFYAFHIKLGERVVATGYQEFGRRITPFKKHFTHIANGGFIHTFSSMQGVNAFFKSWKNVYSFFDMSEYVVVKCYIPKGAQYYKGIFETTGLASYASTELVYGKEIFKDYNV